MPQISDDAGLMRIDACGICGSDYEQFEGAFSVPMPLVPMRAIRAKAFFYLKNVEFSDDRPAEQLQFLKLGDTGKNVRSYTRCCGTLLNTAGGRAFPAGFRPFNRNCITNPDGSKYNPDPASIVNIMKASAFEPEKVPEPNTVLASVPVLAGFVARILGYKLFGLGIDSTMGEEKERAFMVDGAEVTEAVPITWD